MKLSEHVFLRDLQRTNRNTKRPDEIAEICLNCRGKCKAAKGLTFCPVKARWNS